MCKLFLVGWDIEDERFKAIAHIARDFFRNFFVTADEVGTEGLVVLKWPHPIHALHFARFFNHLRQLFMPDRVRDSHGHLMRELALAVARKAFVGNAPRFFGSGASNDTNAHA